MKVYAAMQDWGTTLGGPDNDVATIQSLVPLFANVVQAVLVLSSVVLFIMLLTGGFTYLLSGGDQKKLEQAKGTVTNAIIGLVVLISAYLILSLIASFTGLGSSLTIFRIYTLP